LSTRGKDGGGENGGGALGIWTGVGSEMIVSVFGYVLGTILINTAYEILVDGVRVGMGEESL